MENFINWLENLAIERQKIAIDAETELKQLLKKLKKVKVENVEISFNGSGDDGSIEEIELIPIPETVNSLTEELDDWAYRFLEGTGEDWVNNEGGFGSISIDVKNKTYSFVINQRYESSKVVSSGDNIKIQYEK